MAKIEQRLSALGLILPPPIKPPAGVLLPFQFVRLVGQRAFVSGHGPQNADGSLATPLGKLGRELTVEQGYAAARLTALSILGSLQRALGDLDRVAAWSRVFGMVNSASGFNRQPSVINGFSDLVLELYGDVVGAHARSAVGMAELPFDIPVEIEGEVGVIVLLCRRSRDRPGQPRQRLLALDLGGGAGQEDAVDRPDQHLVAARHGVEKRQVPEHLAVAGDDGHAEVGLEAGFPREHLLDILAVELHARKTPQDRLPILAALSASYHHSAGRPERPYFGSGSAWLKRSHRA